MVESKTNEINVAKYIIKQTPIGHLSQALENLNIVCGEELMDQEEVKAEIKNYQEDHLEQLPCNDAKVIVSKLNKDSDNFYYDQNKNIKFQLAENNKEVTGVETIEEGSELRKAVDAELLKYKEKYYKGGVTTTNVFYDAANGKLNVMISAHNINMKNFWSGEWLSTWELDIGAKNVKGSVKANTYYYEEGNIQFNLKTDFNETVSGEGDDSLAKNLVALIEKKENDVQMDLEKVYDNFSDHYIKPLRRKLPVTGTKMNWNLNQVQYGKH